MKPTLAGEALHVEPGAPVVHDSARRPVPVVDELRNVWEYRGLLGLLVARDVVLRYKRSILGIWWTLLNPLLTMLVLWLVFGSLFRFSTAVPFVVYLLSGLIVYTFFQQVILGSGSAIVQNADVVAKIYVPTEVFCLAAALAAGVNFSVSMIPLVGIMLSYGIALSPTLLLVVVPAALLLCFALGIGLMIAGLAVRFQDTMELTQVGLLLALYLSPVFYPISIIPAKYRIIEEFNPLYHFLTSFRALLYEGTLGPWTAYAAMSVAALGSLFIGGLVFARTWRDAVISL